eukprot:262041_1
MCIDIRPQLTIDLCTIHISTMHIFCVQLYHSFNTLILSFCKLYQEKWPQRMNLVLDCSIFVQMDAVVCAALCSVANVITREHEQCLMNPIVSLIVYVFCRQWLEV